VSRPPETFDTSIPVLTDVIVPGKPDLARTPPRAPEVLPVPGPASANERAHDAGRDADAIADRLRGRFTHFLTGDGRALIEERCRESLQEHSTWLVSQITREVALALETEMIGWVREAVAEELSRPGKSGAI
jgi:Protein of unknown function (DUF2486)